MPSAPISTKSGVALLPSPLCPQVCRFANLQCLPQAGVNPGPFTCTCQVVSLEHISLSLVLVEGLPLGVVQGVVLWLAPVQMGMEPNFVVQVQVQVSVRCLVPWAEVLVHCWAHLRHLHCWWEAGGLCPSTPHPLHCLQ